MEVGKDILYISVHKASIKRSHCFLHRVWNSNPSVSDKKMQCGVATLKTMQGMHSQYMYYHENAAMSEYDTGVSLTGLFVDHGAA